LAHTYSAREVGCPESCNITHKEFLFISLFSGIFVLLSIFSIQPSPRHLGSRSLSSLIDSVLSIVDRPLG
jgi:hypothetical protein